MRPVRHLWHDDHHGAHPDAGQQLRRHLQEQVVEDEDQHEEEVDAGQGAQEDQHPAQPRLLQRNVWGINLKFKIFLSNNLKFQIFRPITTAQVHHKDEVILTPSDDGSREFYDSYAVRQVLIGLRNLP